MSDASTSRKRSLGVVSCEHSNSDSESCDLDHIDGLNENTTLHGKVQNQSLENYYYTERERYLPLANITRSLKDAMNYAMPGKTVRVSKEGNLQNNFTTSLVL